MLLDVLFQRIRAHQQFMQADPPLVTAAAADFAAHRIVDHQLATVAAVIGNPVLQHFRFRRLGILFPGFGILELHRIFDHQRLDFLGCRLVRFLALAAQALGQTLRENAQQRIGKVKRIHAHVEQADD